MDILSRNDLHELANFRAPKCVSIYMPTYWGTDTQQGPIRLKNLVGEALEHLEAQGVRRPAALQVLDPVSHMVDDSSLWRSQGGSLAIFAAQNMCRRFQVPLEVKDLVQVNGHFYLKPLFRLMSDDGLFYVLAVSAHRVRLLQCTRYVAREVSLDKYNIPKHIDDVLKYDEVEKAVQFHTQSAAARPGARRGAMFYGTEGFDQSVHKESIGRYLQAVARGLHAVLHTESAPLVFAGVDYLFPMYREFNDYAHLADRPVVGNSDRQSPDALRLQAWDIVAPTFRTDLEETRGHYELALSKGLGSNQVKDVVPAAANGRVGMLMVSPSPAQWGRYDPRSGDVEMHIDRQEGDDDLCDLAALHTLANSGTVYSVAPGEQPESPVAAIYRW